MSINSIDELKLGSFKGHLFECFIISDFYKQFYNKGSQPSLYFWRDKNGYIEIDCIIDRNLLLTPVEIKSRETEMSDLFDSLNKWNELASNNAANSYVVYAGEFTQVRKNGNLVGWKQAANLINNFV